MDYSFPHYLLAKQTVDDRALNRSVYESLAASLLPGRRLRIIEVGAGIGTMFIRLLRWGLFPRADYVIVDKMAENIEFAAAWIPTWADENGLQVEILAGGQLHLYDDPRQDRAGRISRDIQVSFLQADVFDFIKPMLGLRSGLPGGAQKVGAYLDNLQPDSYDLLIAHAFLDLLPLPESLRGLFALLNQEGLAWLTINFDGVTTLEPCIDVSLDQKIESLYHQSMDAHLLKTADLLDGTPAPAASGDSQSGRHLFGHLTGLGAQILAAGASDWVVYARDGKYPADEAYFLNFILHFFENSLGGHAELDGEAFVAWLAERRAQIDRGELVYIAHQMDFLVKPGGV